MENGKRIKITAVFIALLCQPYPLNGMAAKRRLKDLVVMSYEQNYMGPGD